MSLDVPFGITSEVGPEAVSVAVRGEIDLDNVTHLRSTLNEAVAITKGDIVIDLAEVSYLDSSGLHVLLSAHEQLTALDRRFIVHRPSPAVLRLFELCYVSELFAGSTDGDAELTSQPASDQGTSAVGDN